MIFGPFLALAALVVAIIAIAQLSTLRARIEYLERLLRRNSLAEDLPTPPVPPPLPKSLQTPPPLPVASARENTPVPDRVAGVNWESFVGVRLFAWIGGLALFLGVVFFVKYAFENNLITPGMRIFSGGLVGLILIAAGISPALSRYWIPAQSLIVTGILICYADTYAAHSFYSLISLSAASVLMWLITVVGLLLGVRTAAPAILWLAVIGGYVTPLLFRTNYQTASVLFGYVGVLTCGIAAISVAKRWAYFITAAAICTIIIEFIWAADFFGKSDPEIRRVVFLIFQALFLGMAMALIRINRTRDWSIFGAAIAGLAPLIAFIADPLSNIHSWDSGFLTLVLASAGLISLAAVDHNGNDRSKASAVMVATALACVIVAEWGWCTARFSSASWIVNNAGFVIHDRLAMVSAAAWHAAIFVLFAATPYICGTRRTWPWIIAAITGPLQFWFVHQYLTVKVGAYARRPILPHQWAWILPIAFAVPALIGLLYLVRREKVSACSGDNRLASQAAALITFISLIFPVQFHREWITLGWAVEGLGLILLFEWLPNRRLRAFAMIVLSAAFVRLTLNPAVLEYHPRSHTPILNWYLYAYGVTGLCLFATAYWFGEPLERRYEKAGPPLLYILSGIIFFLLLNIEIADYFSIGPTLTFSFAENFARDTTYTISWAVFAFVLLLIGMFKQIRPVRLAAIALLCVALVKLFLHDLDSLSQLYRIAAFISVAIIAMIASFAYQRFLSPAVEK